MSQLRYDLKISFFLFFSLCVISPKLYGACLNNPNCGGPLPTIDEKKKMLLRDIEVINKDIIKLSLKIKNNRNRFKNLTKEMVDMGDTFRNMQKKPVIEPRLLTGRRNPTIEDRLRDVYARLGQVEQGVVNRFKLLQFLQEHTLYKLSEATRLNRKYIGLTKELEENQQRIRRKYQELTRITANKPPAGLPAIDENYSTFREEIQTNRRRSSRTNGNQGDGRKTVRSRDYIIFPIVKRYKMEGKGKSNPRGIKRKDPMVMCGANGGRGCGPSQ